MTVSVQALAPVKAALTRETTVAAFENVIPETMKALFPPARINHLVVTAMHRNPILADCTIPSLILSTMGAVSIGLDPSGGPLGQAYLVPYRNNKTGRREAQLIIGYRGFITLARRSGEISVVEASCVYEGEIFKFVKGSEPRVIHEPFIVPPDGFDENKNIIGAYSVATFSDGQRHLHWMPIVEIEKRRKVSRMSGKGPWIDWYGEMCRKTVIRNASKNWPLSADLVTAIDFESRAESGEHYPILPAEENTAEYLPEATEIEAKRIEGETEYDETMPPDQNELFEGE